jgi:NTP pyrophosphatase (non-canonical NTP hydrolase)
MGQITDWQARAWANKIAKGFSTTNVESEFNLTYAELAEVYEAYRRGKPNIGEELADVMIFVLSLAKMLEVDLEKEMSVKLEKNEQRQYEKQDNGHHVQKGAKL